MKQFKNLIIIVMLMGYHALIASPIGIHSLEDALNFGEKHNPSIRAQKQGLLATEQQPKIMGSLSDPKIGLRLNGSPAKIAGNSFDQQRVFVNQSFPLLGTLKRKRKIGHQNIRVAKIEFIMMKKRVKRDIQLAYYDLILNQELSKITQKNAQLLEGIINITDIKYQSGKTHQANVLKARVSKGKLDERLFQLEHQKRLLIETLKKACGISSQSQISLTLKYPETIHWLQTTPNSAMVDNTLSVQKSKAEYQQAKLKHNIEKDRYLPHLNTQLEYWNNSGMKNQTSGQIAMTIPWFYSKNRAQIRSAAFHVNSQESFIQFTKNHMGQTLISLHSDLITTQKIILLYENSILKNARLSLSSFQKAFEVDKASFLDYFESEKTLFSLEKRYARLIHKRYRIQATLNALFEKETKKNEH